MSQLETVRTFVAVPISAEVAAALDRIQRKLKRAGPDSVRWVDPAGVHLTIHFLGDVLTDRIAPIKEALGVVARNVPPFEFRVAHLGAFPNANRPRVVWVGVEDTTSWLALLHQAVNEALAKLGFQPEQRAFSPHLTLGRVRRSARAGEVRALGEVIAHTDIGILGTVTVETLILFQSTLSRQGAVYEPLGIFELGASQGNRTSGPA